MEGRMCFYCENTHVKQTSRVRGSGFAAVTTVSMRRRAVVIGARTKYCKGTVGEIHRLTQMAQVKNFVQERVI